MSEMTVGCIHTTVTPQQSGIYEALLEKTERERDEARATLKVVEQSHHSALYREGELKRERDHYRQALEEISTTVQEYKDSMVQEPAEDFIWAVKAWADKKLKEV